MPLWIENLLAAAAIMLEPSLGVWPKDHLVDRSCFDRTCSMPSCQQRETVAEFIHWWRNIRA